MVLLPNRLSLILVIDVLDPVTQLYFVHQELVVELHPKRPLGFIVGLKLEVKRNFLFVDLELGIDVLLLTVH